MTAERNYRPPRLGRRLGVLAFAVGLVAFQLSFLPEITDSDSTLYLDAAYSHLHPGAIEDRLPMVRPGITLPLAAAIAAFGVTPASARLPVALATVGTLLLAYRLGERLGGRGVGRAAAAVLLLTPQFHLLGNLILPEGLLVFFGAAAAAAWMAAASSRHPLGWAALSGLAVGCAYLTKVTGLYLLAVLLALAFAEPWRGNPRRWRCLAAAAGTVAAVWLAELALFGVFTGNPWHRISATQPLRVAHWLTYVAPRWEAGAATFLDGLRGWWRTHTAPLGSYGLLLWFAATAAIIFWWHRQLKRIAIPLAWLLVLTGLLAFETIAYLDFYPRRFAPILAPAALLVGSLAVAWRVQLGRVLTLFLLAPLALFGVSTLVLLATTPGLRVSPERRAWDLITRLDPSGAAVVLGDCRLVGFLRLYDGYRHPSRFRDLSRLAPAAAPPGAVVALPSSLPPECLMLRRFDLASAGTAATGWQLKGTVTVGPASALRIYRVPQ